VERSRILTAVVGLVALWLWLARSEGTAAFFLATSWLIVIGLAVSWRGLSSRERGKRT